MGDGPVVLQRFLSYVSINTTSDPTQIGKETPTSPGQRVLGEKVAGELQSLGVSDVHIDTHGIVYGVVPAASGFESAKSIGFAPHLDTAPDYCTDTAARVVRGYNGGSIDLELRGRISAEELTDYIGDDIVVTDGTSLLGSDDKAAIAAVITAVEEVMQIGKHGRIFLAFLPDEEIGLLGAKAVDLQRFAPDFGYCLDCCAIGEYATKTWYAASASVCIRGKPAHPMNAKGRLLNPMHVLCDEVLAHLPKEERLEHTEGEEGAISVTHLDGCATHAKARLNLRYFDVSEMTERKQLLQKLIDDVNGGHGAGTAELSINDMYSNPEPLLAQHPHVMQVMLDAMRELHITPKPFIMRGGYDGCALADRGLPFANFFTGGHNFHGNTEFLPVRSLVAAKDMVRTIIEMTARQTGQ